MSRRSRLPIGCAVVLVQIVAVQPSLEAFNYSEHVLLNQDAITLLSPKEQAWVKETEKREWTVLTERSKVSGNGLSSADIPALTGDLSTDPGSLIYRLFSYSPADKKDLIVLRREPVLPARPESDKYDCQPNDERESKPRVANASDIAELDSEAVKVAKVCVSRSSECPDVKLTKDMLRMAHYNLSHFNTTEWLGPIPSHRLEAQQDDLSKYFRVHWVATTYGAFEHSHQARTYRRLVLRANETAVAYYLELHAGAVLFRNLASTIPGEKRAEMEAFSLFLEQASLHYLNDLGVPGHHLKDSSMNKDFIARREFHQQYNENGRQFVPADQLCRVALESAANLPNLAAYCSHKSKDSPGITIYGDGRAFVNGPPKRVTPGPVYTAEVAKAIAASSMREYLEVSLDPLKDAAVKELFEMMGRDAIVQDDRFSYVLGHKAFLTPVKWRWVVWSEAWTWGPSDPVLPVSANAKVRLIEGLWRNGGFRTLDMLPRFTDESGIPGCKMIHAVRGP